MGRTSIILICSWLLASATAAAPPLPRKVLITYFEPFDGAAVNASEAIAKKVAMAKGLGADVELCRLPVVYDQGSSEAKKCFEKSEPKPDYVISLGEAGCSVRFETAAHNRDSNPDLPDNSGAVRNGKVIEANGPTSISMTFPIDEILCGSELSEAESKQVTLSATPGGFVCNNTAYSLARYFEKSAPSTRYGFVHIPSHECSTPDSVSPDVSAEILKKYIKNAIAIDAAKSKTAPASSCSKAEEFPQSLQEFATKINSLKDIGTKACRTTYLNEALSKRIYFLNEER